VIKFILNIYGQFFGLKVNLQKSKLLVTSTTLHQVQQLAQDIGCKATDFSFQYLDMPLSNKKIKKKNYLPLIQRVKNKLSGWKTPLLSSGGRSTLMNSTLSAIPILFMFTFILPSWVIKEIDKIRRKFL
jgi:hypothetical protein